MNRLETLCRPLIRLICQYWCYAKAGAIVDAEQFRRRIQNVFSNLRNQCEDDPLLKREFARIERPLLFFIDYTVKEGPFSFNRQWRELARDFNELSGDEKFFDLLTENLDDPEASERLLLFYLMMGLGFDGCYHGDGEYVERRMRLCATRFQAHPRLEDISLFSGQPGGAVPAHGKKVLSTVLAFAAVFAVLAFIYNCYVFNRDSSGYYGALQQAVEKARPTNTRSSSSHAEEMPAQNIPAEKK